MKTALLVSIGLSTLCFCNPIKDFSSLMRTASVRRKRHFRGTWNKRELDEERSEERLETLIRGENGSFGNMFEVTGKSDLIITGLEFYCDLKQNLTYAVYTKSGSYVGYESSPGNWTMLLNETILTLGPGRPTPTHDFAEPIHLENNLTQSFYVTLMQPDIRYTEADEENVIVAEDENLQIFVGVGVAGYPFGHIYRPRIFNGAVRYISHASFSPSSTPSYSSPSPSHVSLSPSSSSSVSTLRQQASTVFPSTMPSIKTSSAPTFLQSNEPSIEAGTIIRLSYLLEHKISDNVFELPSAVDATVTDVLETIFLDETKKIKPIVSEHVLELVGIKSSLADMASDESLPCVVEDITHICSIVNIEVKVSYDGSISEEEVRYSILYYSNEIGNALDFFNNVYIGHVTVETEIYLTLHGTNITTFDTDSLNLFENEMKTFYNDQFDGVTIAAVKVQSQEINSYEPKVTYEDSSKAGAKPKKRSQVSFAIQSSAKVFSLDFTVVVTGEYLPPPSIDFGYIVTDSLSAEGDEDDFLNYIQPLPEFSHVTSIIPRASVNVDPDDIPDYVATSIEEQGGMLQKKWFYSATGAVGFIVILTISVFGYLRLQKKERKVETMPIGSLNYNIERFTRNLERRISSRWGSSRISTSKSSRNSASKSSRKSNSRESNRGSSRSSLWSS